jgi:hypothetical protein
MLTGHPSSFHAQLGNPCVELGIQAHNDNEACLEDPAKFYLKLVEGPLPRSFTLPRMF